MRSMVEGGTLSSCDIVRGERGPLHHAASRRGPPPRSGEEFGRLAGLAGLAFGWAPETFWNATPAELAALVRAALGDTAEPLDGQSFVRLQEMFPDG